MLDNPWLILLLPLGFIYLCLAIINYKKAFFILLIIGPLVTTQFISGTTSYMQLLFPPIALGVFIAIATKKQSLENFTYDKPLLIYLFALLIVSIASGLKVTGLLGEFQAGIINLINITGFVFCFSVFLQDEKDLQVTYIAWVLGSVFVALIAIVEFISTSDLSYRARGTFWNPNYLGIHLASGAIICLGLLYTRKSGTKKRYNLALSLGVLITTTGLIMTVSLGAILALLVGVIILVLGARISLMRLCMFIFLLIFSIVLLNITTEGRLVHILQDRTSAQNLSPVGAETAVSRMLQYKIVTQIFIENPILGIGLNNYGSVLSEYVPWLSLTKAETMSARYIVNYVLSGKSWVTHNDPLAWLAETGILGFGLFVIFQIFSVYYCLQTLHRLRHVDSKQDLYALGVIALSLYVTTFVFSLTHNYKALIMYWEPLVMIWVFPRLVEPKKFARALLNKQRFRRKLA